MKAAHVRQLPVHTPPGIPIPAAIPVLGAAIGFVVLPVARTLPVLFAGRVIDGLTGGNINVAQVYIIRARACAM